MRVLFIGPLPDPVTGQSLACKILFDALTEVHHVELVDLNKRGLVQGVSSLGRLFAVLHIVWRTLRLQSRSDVIYFTISESIAGNLKDLLIYLVCRGRLDRMVVHMHGGAGMRRLLSDRQAWLARANAFFLRKLGAVIVLGPRHVPIFSDAVAAARIHKIPNFAEDYMFITRQVALEKYHDTIPLRLLFLSNHLPGKGHEELVSGFKMLDPQEQSLVQIDFAGGFESDAAREVFLNSIRANEQLRYHGVVRGEEKRALFRMAHLFCLPTYYPYEGQPISILEAYASGCAVLTTDHSGIFDVFDCQRNGLEVEIQSAQSITIAIRTALQNPPVLQKMGLRNLQEAEEKYRVERFIASVSRVLEDVADPGRNGSKR